MSEKKYTNKEMLDTMTPGNEDIIKASLNNIDYIESAINKNQNDLLKRLDIKKQK